MPSSMNLNGLRLYRPGIYAVIDASALGGSGVSTGNVAVVGDFPLFKTMIPYTFSNARALSDWSLGDAGTQQIAKLAFSPSTDDRVAGGAATLTLVNAGVNTVASKTFSDGAADSLVLKSRLWGNAGNRIFAEIAVNAANANAKDIILKYNGQTEKFTAIESGAVFTLTYDGGLLDGAKATFDANDKYKIVWEINEALVASKTDEVFAVPKLPHARCDSAGTTITLSVSNAEQQDVVVTVTGKGAAGAALTENITIPAGNLTAIGASSFAEITALDYTTGAGGNETLTVSGHAFNLDPANFANIKEVTDLIGGAAGFTVVEKNPRLGGIPAGEIDELPEQGIGGAVKEWRADLYEIVRAVNTSAFVSAERTASATKPPVAGSGFLLGGTQAAAILGGHTTALAAVVASDIQIVVSMSTDVGVHQAVVAHCNDAALYGYERCAWVGTPASKTLTEVFDGYSSKLNTRHVAVCGQSIKVAAPDGSTPTLDPPYTALTMACMQAGTAVATPLTRKRPAVLDVIGEWNGVLDANEAIQKGIASLSYDALGWRIERSVTSYMSDDNPIYSEVSANESVNTSVRTLRNRLNIEIGNPILSSTSSALKGFTQSSLEDQVRDGVIKAWQNLIIEDLGDTFSISYEVAAVEPLNFIKIIANVVRIAASV